MSSHQLIILAGGLATMALGVATAVFRARTVAQKAFLAAMVLLTAEAGLQSLSLGASSVAGMLFWQRAAWVPRSLLPLVWLAFSLTFARGEAHRYLRPWRMFLLLASIAPVVLIGGFSNSVVTGAAWTSASGTWVFAIGVPGKCIAGLITVSCVLVLSNVEGTVRSAVGTARWKIKYAVMGLAIWCGTQIYSASQILLYSEQSVPSIVITSVGTLLAGFFFSVATVRSRLANVDIYPSPAALHRSLAVLLSGAYLAVIGLVAKLTTLWGGAGSFPMAQVVVMVGLGGLGVLCLSDRVRATTRRFISRHFQRSKHDYRRVWSGFAQRTATCLEPREYSRQAAGLISETFEALSVTVWLVERDRFTFGASTAVEARDASASPMDEAVFRELVSLKNLAMRGPVELNRCREPWCACLKGSHPVWFPKIAGECYCLPLVFGGELVGLVVVGDRVAGMPFTAEDLDLLKCLGDQMAAGLRTVSLSDELVRARELEAFQMMSAFLVHDLKNTASALSLTLKNLPRHFDNPAFREDALRTLGRSVERVNDLIARLGALRGKIELRRAPADLNQIVTTARQLAGEVPHCAVVERLGVLPRLSLDATQIESVVVNLLFNAREAIGERGEIQIETGVEGPWVYLVVADNGCGMSAEFVARSLFQPFKTSKKNGLGIGMYQSRTIVEAHGGRVTVQSEPGRGSRFRVCLPVNAGVKIGAI